MNIAILDRTFMIRPDILHDECQPWLNRTCANLLAHLPNQAVHQQFSELKFPAGQHQALSTAIPFFNHQNATMLHDDPLTPTLGRRQSVRSHYAMPIAAWDASGRLLAAMEFSASAWKVAPRDRFLRWTPEQRAARLHLIVDPSTFLILPWVKVQFLASSLLAQVARRLAADWRARYLYGRVGHWRGSLKGSVSNALSPNRA